MAKKVKSLDNTASTMAVDSFYAVVPVVTPADGQLVGANETGTFLCSAEVSFTPTSAVSSFVVSSIELEGNTTDMSISADRAFPAIIVNGVDTGILFNVVFANTSNDETVTAQSVSAALVVGDGTLSSGVTGEVQADSTYYSSVFTISGDTGWVSPGGRVWKSHAEFLRKHLLGYF